METLGEATTEGASGLAEGCIIGIRCAGGCMVDIGLVDDFGGDDFWDFGFG